MSTAIMSTAIQLDQRFTLYLNAAGEPVQRALGEMTAGEALTAIEWQRDIVAQLEAAAAPFEALAAEIEAGDDRADIPLDVFRTAAAAMHELGVETLREADLMQLVAASMPQWRNRAMSLEAALQRYWPR